MAPVTSLRFGLNIDPATRRLELAWRLAAVADEAGSGYDFIGVQDHPYLPDHLDTWTLLTALGARTARVRLLPNVLNLPLRPPAMLAKSAATLAVITGGRFEMGVGAGAMWDAITSYGGPRRAPGEAVKALREGIGVMRALWSGGREPVTRDGAHYRLEGARPGPAPGHPIAIWLGALGPRMLRLTGELANGWIVSAPYVPPTAVPALSGQIDAAAEGAGRDPASIRRAYNLMGAITRPGGPSLRAAQPGQIIGPPEQWVEEIARYARDLGMDTFFFWPLIDEEAQARAFADEVIPAVRAALGSA